MIDYVLLNMLKNIIVLLFVISPILFFTQTIEKDKVDTTYIYKNLEDALVNPNQVFHLKLKRKKLKEFPLEVLKFKNLITLDLTKNKISSIPYEIKELKYLKTLKLNKNKFTVFPKAICLVTSIEQLEINNNSIVEIPKEIEKLKNLIYLDMWSNELAIFPKELSKLNKLKTFDLRVIQLSDKEQKAIHKLLPNTKIYMSNSCNCAN